jgi:hypothetical protein
MQSRARFLNFPILLIKTTISRNKNLKKKRMLDLMIRKKMSSKKKQIIQTYGKEMIAEMYLDLLNITEEARLKSKIKEFGDKSPELDYEGKERDRSLSFKKDQNEIIEHKELYEKVQYKTRNFGISGNVTLTEELKNKSLINRFKAKINKSKKLRQRKLIGNNTLSFKVFNC